MVYLGLAQFGPHSLKVTSLNYIIFCFDLFYFDVADIHGFTTAIMGMIGKRSSFRLLEPENNFNGYDYLQSRISSHHT